MVHTYVRFRSWANRFTETANLEVASFGCWDIRLLLKLRNTGTRAPVERICSVRVVREICFAYDPSTMVARTVSAICARVKPSIDRTSYQTST